MMEKGRNDCLFFLPNSERACVKIACAITFPRHGFGTVIEVHNKDVYTTAAPFVLADSKDLLTIPREPAMKRGEFG